MQQIKDLLPAAIQPNQASAKLESNAPASGEEKKFVLALIEPKIRTVAENDLKAVLKYVMILVGLRAQNYPDDIEKQILLNFIVDHYGGHTCLEIKLAFEMAITRKLDVDPTCYENFSIAYFSRIMEAYREWSREQVKRLPAPVEVKELTQRDKLNISLDYAYYMFSIINKLPVKI